MKNLKSVLILLLSLVVITTTALVAFLGIGDNQYVGIGNIKLGLDLAGGVSITYQAQEENPTSEQMEGALAIINNRLSSLGYTEAQAFIQNGNRIRVEIPGVSDANEAVKQIGKTAMLTFVGVDWNAITKAGLTDEYVDPLTQKVLEELNSQGSSASYSESTVRSNVKEYLSSASSALYYFPEETAEIVQKAIDQGIAKVVLEGEDVASASAQHGPTSSSGAAEDYVKLELNSTGRDQFKEATETYKNKYIAIRLDQTIVSMPSVNVVISDGTAIITGMDSADEAKQLAADIRGGALPVQLEDIEHNSVGATLGQDALATSMTAAVIGFILVLLFMILIYRVPGLVASLSLIFYISAELLLINLLDITLTLPGIAGIILSIGMAVDANIVIFARINEELRSGRGLRASVASGFKKALSAIVDGNVTTLIAAAVLWFLGSGTVQGFALTLALGIVISMFTALVLSNLLLKNTVEILPEKSGLYQSLQFAKKREKSFAVVAKTKLWFAISGVIIVIGLGFLLIRGLNFDIDFAGGTMLQVDMNGEYDNRELTELVKEVSGDANPMIQAVSGAGQENQVSIKVKEIPTDQIDRLYLTIAERFGLDTQNKSNLITQSTISPTVSGEMQRTAVTATLVAALLTLLYITFRFRDVRFGVSSIAALLHDVLIVVAMYAIFYIPVNSTFIAAILTIVGYSINNTIVVFDRVRENQRFYRQDQLGALADDSIMQTLGRSVNTSVTTIIMVLMLFILGVESIRWFAFPLLAGFLAGTYSSLVIASPMWVLLQKIGKNRSRKVPAPKKTANKKK